MLLKDKVAVITGGAGLNGLGFATARMMANQGAKVVILDLEVANPQAAAAQLGPDHLGLVANVTDKASCEAAVEQIKAKYGRIDVLVNGAGHGPKGKLLEISDEDWIKGIEVYFLNVVRATRLVTPHLLQAGGGAIVNISSFAAVEPDPVFPTSAVFRAGLAAYTKLYADRYAKDGIRMNNVLPGWIDSLPLKEERRAAVPMQRYGKAEEVAATIAFLASDAASYITGQSLRVDGGLMRSV